MRWSGIRVGMVCAAGLLAWAPIARAQKPTDRINSNREQLARIRQQRAALQDSLRQLQSRVHSLSDEVDNLDRQHDATQRAVTSLDKQLDDINSAVNQTTAQLVRAEDEATIKHAMLRHRLIEIYKRGPMYDVEALLSAQSFGELVARYKYLHELALRDRALVHRVDELRTTVRAKRGNLVSLQEDVQQNRFEKAQEEERLQSMEQQQQRNLVRVRQVAAKTEERLKRVARSETKMNSLIASLEAARRRSSSRPNSVARGPSSINTSDYGKLAWPVDGNILYKFGVAVNPNNTKIRWNGVGISAAPGTPVKCIAAGRVAATTDALGTYGKTVIIDHGGGTYSVYSSLGTISVAEGKQVSKGQTLGTVGISDPELPPHLHFEIRPNGGQVAVDPADWLRGTR